MSIFQPMHTIKHLIQDIPAMLFLEYPVKMKFGLWFVVVMFPKINCKDGEDKDKA
jgi:hypothetical protein